MVCSSGGHFLELYFLKEIWKEYDHFWVTFDKEDVSDTLKNERVYFAFSSTIRSVKNLIRNMFIAFKILYAEKPFLLVTTGAGVCVPFIYIAKLLGIKTIYIELVTRIRELSLSGKLVYPVVDKLMVQWPELQDKYGKAEYRGRII